jgi:hypothetical protein
VDGWKRTAEVANIVGAIGTVYFVYRAINETLGNAVTPVTFGIQNLGFAFVGVAFVFTCILNLIILRRQPPQMPLGGVQQVLPGVQSVNPAPPIIRGERVIVDVTVEYLARLCKGHTTFQAEQLIKPYLDKWLKVSGIIGDFGQRASSEMELSFQEIGPSMWFDEEWHDRISVLKRGDRITVMGQIKAVRPLLVNPALAYVRLDHCEIIETP